MKLKLLEPFSGSGVLSKTFKEAGHEVITLDFEPTYNPDICCDVLDFDISMLNGFKPNIFHAGVECSCFSVASMGHHWTGGYRAYIPKTEEAKKALVMVDKTFDILKQLNPDIFYFENTEGIFKKLSIVMEYRRKYFYHDLTLCQYGTPGRKPSLWLTNNPFWKPKPKCHNGDICHEAAPTNYLKSIKSYVMILSLKYSLNNLFFGIGSTFPRGTIHPPPIGRGLLYPLTPRR